MKALISTKGRYALRLVVALARMPREEFVPLKEIAAQQGISEKYLEAIVRRLADAGVLDGQRGRGGGYRLRRLPGEYSAGEILAVMEDDLLPVACMRPGAEECERADKCATLPLWRSFYAVVQDFFGSVTVADLAAGRNGFGPTPPRGPEGGLFEDGAGI